MFVVRKLLSALEGAIPFTRYNPATNEVETSADGGATWTPNAGADPRVNPAYQVAPNEEPDPRCAAAEGMTLYIRQSVDAGIASATIVGVGNSVLGLLLFALPITWMYALIWAIAEALVTIGSAALITEFTEDVYDQLRCALYDNLNAEGQIDQAGLDAFQAEADAIEALVVGPVVHSCILGAGVVGFNNFGAKQADPEAECACGWCYYAPLDLDDGDFTPYVLSGTAGNYASASGWEAVNVSSWGGFDRTLLMGRFIFDFPITPTSIDLHYNWVVGTSSPLTEGLGVYVNDFATNLYSANQNFMTTGDDQTVNIATGIPEDITSLDVWLQPAIGAFAGSAVMTIVQMRGDGDPPTWLEDMGWLPC